MTNASRAPVDFDAFARDLQPSGGAPRASEPAAQKPDPLAELARIVGQDDPFRALLAARDDRRQPAPQTQAPGRVEPRFAEEVGHPGAQRNTPADAFDQYLASVDHGGAQQAAYGQARDFQAQQDFQAQGFQTQGFQTQGFETQDFQAGPGEAEVHDQRGLKRVKPRRRLVTVGAGVAVVVVAVTGALTYKGLHRGGTGGGVPVIQADASPVKVAPKVADGVEIPDQDRQIYEPKAKDSQIRIVNREEQPLDVAQAARAAQGSAQGQERSGQDRGTEAAVTPGSASFDAFGQPRKVRTVVVKPDTPPPAAQREVQAEALPLSPIPTMTLPGEDAPVRTRPGRMAAATPQMPVQTATVQQAPSQAVPVQAPPAPERTPAAAAPAPVRAKSPQRIAAVSPESAAPAESPATTATVSNAAVGGFSVQLGVRTSAREAQAALREMQGKYGQLAGKPELIRQAEVNGKTIFRVRVGPLAKAEATSLCTELQGAGGQCFVAKN
ncbi:SPOR domain-containing protein [uncultured Methylobacterium sp.]|uniref:SPOR domain-containing protein n=1 Tax=uncultured Methylobacterium sp. TaxID=157278 RepID=UPI0035CB0B4C